MLYPKEKSTQVFIPKCLIFNVVKTGELSNSILTEMIDFIEVIKEIDGAKEE